MTAIVTPCLALLAFLFIPGALFLGALGLPVAWSLCCGPLISLSLIALIGQLCAFAGVAATPVLLTSLLSACVLLAFLLARMAHIKRVALPFISWSAISVYVLVGAALGYNLFLSRLGSPEALFQAYDVTQHINLIQSMSESGRFTSIGASAYMSAADAAIAPIDSSSFYPAAWHCLCALVIMITGAVTTTAINASMFVFACLVFPLAMLAFIAAIFPEEKRAQLIGALVVCSFASFPWNLLTFGPVFPNVAGFSLMPIAMALFTQLIGVKYRNPERARIAVLLLVGLVGLVLCHPNTVFSCIVILSPYCVHRIIDACNAKNAKTPVVIGCAAAFILFVVAFWYVCFRLPFFQSTVTHVWLPYVREWQEIVNILLLSPTFGFFTEMAAQYVLAIVVLIGLVCSFNTPGKRWTLASYLLPCGILVISASQSSDFKQFVAGFWYTDPMRLAAVCAIAAIPLAIQGISWVYGMLMRLLASYGQAANKPIHPRRATLIFAMLFMLLNFLPEFNLPGMHYTTPVDVAKEYEHVQVRDWPKGFHTTFGDYRWLVKSTYQIDAPLDDLEEQFLDRIQEMIDPNALIINCPMDGSFLAYGTRGIRVYYRGFLGFGGTAESEESALIRTNLVNISSDVHVQQAVQKIGARYVLLLRGDKEQSGFINLRGDYDDESFSGITSIDESTPGFTLKFAYGPIALYEIDADFA